MTYANLVANRDCGRDESETENPQENVNGSERAESLQDTHPSGPLQRLNKSG